MNKWKNTQHLGKKYDKYQIENMNIFIIFVNMSFFEIFLMIIDDFW